MDPTVPDPTVPDPTAPDPTAPDPVGPDPAIPPADTALAVGSKDSPPDVNGPCPEKDDIHYTPLR